MYMNRVSQKNPRHFSCYEHRRILIVLAEYYLESSVLHYLALRAESFRRLHWRLIRVRVRVRVRNTDMAFAPPIQACYFVEED